MKPDYRFFLTINGGQRKSVTPNYPDDLSLDYEGNRAKILPCEIE